MSAAWTPAFEGQRPPFEEGNEAATTHGAYSEQRLLPLAEGIYRELKVSLAHWDDSFEIPTRAIAEIRARKVLALRYLDEHGLVDDDGQVRPILREVPKWELRERELSNDLALTVRSRAELDLDRLAQARG